MFKVIAQLAMMGITFRNINMNAPLVPLNVANVTLFLFAQNVKIIIN